MNFNKVLFAVACVAFAMSGLAGADGDRIASENTVICRDRLQSFDRIVFEFEGCEAWVVEPGEPAADGRWVWCMEKRWSFGHHPHGVDPVETIRIVNFFQKAMVE